MPMEQIGQPCSTVTRRLVFFTEADHGFDVQRAQGAKIDHFGIDALVRQLLGGFQRQADADRIGHQRHILALLDHARLADGQDEIVDLRHVEGAAIDDFVFQEDHRIGIADRGFQQALGVGGEIGRDHFQAGHTGRTRRNNPGCAGRRRATPAPLGPRNTMGQLIWPPDM